MTGYGLTIERATVLASGQDVYIAFAGSGLIISVPSSDSLLTCHKFEPSLDHELLATMKRVSTNFQEISVDELMCNIVKIGSKYMDGNMNKAAARVWDWCLGVQESEIKDFDPDKECPELRAML